MAPRVLTSKLDSLRVGVSLNRGKTSRGRDWAGGAA